MRRTYLPENYHVIQEMHLLNEEDQRKLRRRERAKRMRRKLTSLVKRRRVTCTLLVPPSIDLFVCDVCSPPHACAHTYT